jgi:hypothetical protein
MMNATIQKRRGVSYDTLPRQGNYEHLFIIVFAHSGLTCIMSVRNLRNSEVWFIGKATHIKIKNIV